MRQSRQFDKKYSFDKDARSVVKEPTAFGRIPFPGNRSTEAFCDVAGPSRPCRGKKKIKLRQTSSDESIAAKSSQTLWQAKKVSSLSNVSYQSIVGFESYPPSADDFKQEDVAVITEFQATNPVVKKPIRNCPPTDSSSDNNSPAKVSTSIKRPKKTSRYANKRKRRKPRRKAGQQSHSYCNLGVSNCFSKSRKLFAKQLSCPVFNTIGCSTPVLPRSILRKTKCEKCQKPKRKPAPKKVKICEAQSALVDDDMFIPCLIKSGRCKKPKKVKIYAIHPDQTVTDLFVPCQIKSESPERCSFFADIDRHDSPPRRTSAENRRLQQRRNAIVEIDDESVGIACRLCGVKSPKRKPKKRRQIARKKRKIAPRKKETKKKPTKTKPRTKKKRKPARKARAKFKKNRSKKCECGKSKQKTKARKGKVTKKAKPKKARFAAAKKLRAQKKGRAKAKKKCVVEKVSKKSTATPCKFKRQLEADRGEPLCPILNPETSPCALIQAKAVHVSKSRRPPHPMYLIRRILNAKPRGAKAEELVKEVHRRYLYRWPLCQVSNQIQYTVSKMESIGFIKRLPFDPRRYVLTLQGRLMKINPKKCCLKECNRTYKIRGKWCTKCRKHR